MAESVSSPWSTRPYSARSRNTQSVVPQIFCLMLLSGLLRWGNLGTFMIGTITALYAMGAAVGAFYAAFTIKPLKRNRGFLLGAFVLIVGITIICALERPQFMVQESWLVLGLAALRLRTHKIYKDYSYKIVDSGLLIRLQRTSHNIGYYLDGRCFLHTRLQQRMKCIFLDFRIVISMSRSRNPSQGQSVCDSGPDIG